MPVICMKTFSELNDFRENSCSIPSSINTIVGLLRKMLTVSNSLVVSLPSKHAGCDIAPILNRKPDRLVAREHGFST